MFGARHQHGAAAQLVGIFLQLGADIGDVGGHQVVGHDVLEETQTRNSESWVSTRPFCGMPVAST